MDQSNNKEEIRISATPSAEDKKSFKDRLQGAFNEMSKEKQLMFIYAAIGVIIVFFILNSVKLYRFFF